MLFTTPRPAALTERYRPETLSEVLGQPNAVAQLQAFAAAPYPVALLFHGPTGTGKTCAARALASELGVAVDEQECGGLYSIASGEQTGDAVRAAMSDLRCCPLMGSGWRVLVVNECDRMSDAAAFVWLDALENLPSRSVVVFTTNDVSKLPQRLRDRCESVEFVGASDALRQAAQQLVTRIWTAERNDPAPSLSQLPGCADGKGHISFRRVLQLLAPLLRTGIPVVQLEAPEPSPIRDVFQPIKFQDPEQYKRDVIATCKARLAAATRQPVGV